jgi:hypothetical protein
MIHDVAIVITVNYRVDIGMKKTILFDNNVAINLLKSLKISLKTMIRLKILRFARGVREE